MTATYQRTTTAHQGDTLDDIAHRVYAHRSIDMLPQLIESNPAYSPVALLPLHAIIILPDDNTSATAPTIKLWD